MRKPSKSKKPKSPPVIEIVTRETVIAKAAQDFPDSDVNSIMTILDEYGLEDYHRDRNGIQIRKLQLSEGNLEDLRYYTDEAKQDWRNIIYWADYPHDPEEEKREYLELLKMLEIDKDGNPMTKESY